MLNQPTTAPERARVLCDLVERLVIEEDKLVVTMRRAALTETGADPISLSVPVRFRRRGVEMKLVIADNTARPARLDPALIKSVARGHLWFDDVASGRAASLQAIAEREGVTEGYVRRLIRLAFLAPGIVEAILDGRQPVTLTARYLKRLKPVPTSWSEQRRLLGF